MPVLRRWFEELSDRLEDLFALIFYDGTGWKDPKRDRRNGF
jgi:hypothetical protein